MDTNDFFIPAGFVMIRTPLLSLDALKVWLEKPDAGSLNALSAGEKPDAGSDTLEQQRLAVHDYLRESIADDVVQEAILVGSPDLFQAIPAWLQTPSSKKGRKAEINLHRYLTRMASRPTPFGLFAGVSLGRLGPQMDARIGATKKNRKRTRPDMQWLLYLVRQLEQRSEVVPHLRYFSNPMTFTSGGRLYLPNVDSYGQAETEKTVSLRATPIVNSVLAFARQGATLDELKQHVHTLKPDLAPKQVTGFLDGLRQQGALLSNLRPPLTNPDAVRYVLAQISAAPGCEDIRAQLESTLRLAEHYDALPLGEGVATFQELYKAMAIAGDAKIHSTLEVDMATDCAATTFSLAVAEEVARAAQVLLRIAGGPPEFTRLAAYRREFMERYGEGREVSVLELLDEDIGLGALPTYQHPPRNKQEQSAAAPAENARRNRALLALAASALQRRQREIVLDETALSQLQVHENWQQVLPNSMELYASIAAPSQQSINDGNYQIVVGPRIGDQPAGRSFGRFCDVMGEDAITTLRDLVREEESWQPQRIFAELVYLPTHGHAANVAIRPATRRFEVVIAASPGVPYADTLPMDDLVVGARGDRFYLRSRSRNAEVIITNTHLLNYSMAPNVCRFLSEISIEGSLSFMQFDWGAASQMPFLPRLRVGRSILTPAQWRLPAELIGTETSKSRPSPEEWYQRVQTWRQLWDVPRYVYMAESDNRLLLDLENPLCVDDLGDECWLRRNNISIVLEEMLPGFEDTWTEGAEGVSGRYLLEFIVPLKRRQPSIMPALQLKKHAPIARADRLCLPGSDWLYAKLYSGQTRHDDLLAGPVREFAQEALKKGLVERWFFIRYADPSPHLRLRFQGESATLLSQVLPPLTTWSNALVEHGLIHKLVLDSYDREIERYGGLKGMQLAEQMFDADSSAVTSMIALRMQRKLNIAPVDLALHTTDNLLESLGLPVSERLDLYRMLRKGQEKLFGSNAQTLQKTFHTYRKTAQRILGDPQWLLSRPGGAQLQECLQVRAAKLQGLGTQLRTLVGQEQLETPVHAFLASCVHMHCNRLLGVNRQQEFEVMYYLERTLESVERYAPEGVEIR